MEICQRYAAKTNLGECSAPLRKRGSFKLKKGRYPPSWPSSHQIPHLQTEPRYTPKSHQQRLDKSDKRPPNPKRWEETWNASTWYLLKKIPPKKGPKIRPSISWEKHRKCFGTLVLLGENICFKILRIESSSPSDADIFLSGRLDEIGVGHQNATILRILGDKLRMTPEKNTNNNKNYSI